MRLSDYRDTYYEFSGKASDVARNLAFAGIAFIWIFRVGEPIPQVPQGLLLPALTLALALALDLLHYIWATIAWGTFHRYHELHPLPGETDPELDAPPWINWITLTMFGAKLLSVAVAYFVLLGYVWRLWVD